MQRIFVGFLLLFICVSTKAQIDIHYALDDGRLSQKANILSVSLDDALRGNLALYYTREFNTLDLSIGISRQMFEALRPDFYFFDMYKDLGTSGFQDAIKLSFVYDQIIQSIENYGFSFRIYAQQFYYQPEAINYQSIAFTSGLLFKPVMNNNWYINGFIGFGGALYESSLGKSGLSAFMSIEGKIGYKFKF